MTAPKKRVTGPQSPRERIVAAATVEFAEQGFEGARVDAIARRARVNKALLYYYVGNKDALYTAVLLENLAYVGPKIRAACEEARTPQERILAYADAFERLAGERPCMPRVILRELASGGQHLAPSVLQAFLEVFSVIRGTLQAGQSSGEFRPIDPLTAHVLLVGGTMLLRTVRPLRARAAEAVGTELPAPGGPDSRLAADIVLNGLLLHPRPAVAAADATPEENRP